MDGPRAAVAFVTVSGVLWWSLAGASVAVARAGGGDPEALLHEAAVASLRARDVHVETDAAGRPSSEDFISPDRYRGVFPSGSGLDPTNPELRFPSPVIVVGRWVYVPDSLAPAPGNQLFVRCPQRSASRPDAFSLLVALSHPRRVTEPRPGLFRARLGTTTADNPLARFGAEGRVASVSVNRGRVAQIGIDGSRAQRPFRTLVSLVYNVAMPIEAPSVAQLKPGGCHFAGRP